MGPVLSIMNRIKNLGITDHRILMLGLDDAGKTTILYKLKLGELVTTIPTVGYNVEHVRPAKGLQFTIWDVGGHHQLRPLWRHFYNKSDGVIFVIDSADRERIMDAKEELHGMLSFQELRGVPLLVVANKQDLEDALPARELVNQLDLASLSGRRWYVLSACAKTGEGLTEAMDELASMVTEFKGTRS